jgi:hypothetical protein
MNKKDHLLDFETNDSEKSRYFIVLIILFISSILVLLSDLVFDSDYQFAIKQDVDWNFAFLMLVLPTIGTFLFVKQNRFGWAICLFYYELMAILLVTTFLRDFLRKGFDNPDLMAGWRAYILLFGSIILILMLVSKDIRYYFKITTSNFRTTLFISSIIILVVVVMILIP